MIRMTVSDSLRIYVGGVLSSRHFVESRCNFILSAASGAIGLAAS
jgi:hypothetical protein